MTLFLATRNRHKTHEIQKILGNAAVVMDLRGCPHLPIIEETGTTFTANAILKAEGISRHVGGWVLADDSGLEVDALQGEPGIYSARYAGPGCCDLENRRLVLKKMDGIAHVERSARFRCVLAVAREGKTIVLFEGSVEGSVAMKLQGEGGFGYDPIFIPDGYHETFGVLSQEIKNTISHRSHALEQFKKWWSTEK